MDLLLQDLALDLYLLPLLLMLLVQGKQPDKLWLIRLTGVNHPDQPLPLTPLLMVVVTEG